MYCRPRVTFKGHFSYF